VLLLKSDSGFGFGKGQLAKSSAEDARRTNPGSRWIQCWERSQCHV